MSDLNDIVRRHWLGVSFILASAAAAIAVWYYHLPMWLLVLCLVFMGFAIVGLLGDLGLFGGSDDD